VSVVLALILATAAGPAKPARVASLNLAADEVLVELVPPERLVGVTSWGDDPDSSNVAGRLPAGAVRFPKADIERLVALRPDVVVVSEYTDADAQRLLERSGLRTHRMEGLGTLAGIRAAILRLGEVVGEPAAAQRLVASYDAKLAAVAARLTGARRPRVLYWANPHTAGGDTTIGSLIECGGGSNVGRELGLVGIQPVGAERAFVAAPEVVLVGGVAGAAEAVTGHPLLAQLAAVREGRLVVMPTRLLVALSQHAATSCEWLAGRLHPERFRKP
jgi:iron complex transport system substrate-binding protein